jgi:ABC-type Mn2+/Zn2+ transport system permease subunit
VIQDFVASWPLFHNTYLCGWFISVLLALVGVLVVARDQIFLGAAVSQASMLGITTGMRLAASSALAACAWCRSDLFLSLAGGAFAVLGALMTGNLGLAGRESRESITGWVFLLGSSFSVLFVAHSPHGMEEVHRLLSSTIIGANAVDVAVFAAMAALTAAAYAAVRDRLLLLVMDPEMARAVGLRVDAWNIVFSVWLGLSVGLSLRVSGMTYTFGCLVLPALVAKSLCREVGNMFVAAPLAAIVTVMCGFVLANEYDYPPSQIAVALLSVLLAAAWGIRRLRSALARG